MSDNTASLTEDSESVTKQEPHSVDIGYYIISVDVVEGYEKGAARAQRPDTW